MGGKPLCRSAIYQIFNKPFYHGRFEYSGQHYVGKHEPMVTEAEYQRVQTLLHKIENPRPQLHPEFAFTGLIRCGGCTHMVTAEEKHQLICSTCKLKFAHRARNACPGCQTPIEKMIEPLFLRYSYYEYPKGSDSWHTGRHSPMVTEKEFDAVQQFLKRFKHTPKNRKLFAFTGLIRCGQCESGVTAEEKHQIICSKCKYKFAHRSKESCPKCKMVIVEMKKALELNYTYYHCTRSSNPDCAERGIERKELEKQITEHIRNVHLPIPYEVWVNNNFFRGIKNQTEDVLAVILKFFPGSAPTVQRDIVTALFSNLVLKDRKIIVALQTPFSFRGESELSGPLDQNTLADETLQE
jgi:uncharacterized Zn ribbon protein